VHFTRLTILTLAAALAVVSLPKPATAASEPAGATDSTQPVMATVHQFIDGFNKGDVKAALAACADRTSVIDEFPPHEWQGSTACADWARDLAASNEREGISRGVVTLSAPWRVDVSGDRAYVVVPARYAYDQHGKHVAESGSIFTLALQKVAGRWRITGWAWAAH
jgi:hypothetical protein